MGRGFGGDIYTPQRVHGFGSMMVDGLGSGWCDRVVGSELVAGKGEWRRFVFCAFSVIEHDQNEYLK